MLSRLGAFGSLAKGSASVSRLDCEMFGRKVCGYAAGCAGAAACICEKKGLLDWMGSGDTADGGFGNDESRAAGRGEGS